MAESSTEGISKISRRNFITGAVGVGAAALLAREVDVMHEGLKTDAGIFYPLYESHLRGIEAKDLPPDLDGFFREGAFTPLSTFKPTDILNQQPFVHPFLPILGPPLLKEEIIHLLARQKAKIILGDVAVAEAEDEITSMIATLALQGVKFSLGNLLIRREVAKNDSTRVTRRGFLKGAGIVLAAPAASFMLASIYSIGYIIGENIQRKNAISRIVGRLSGIGMGHLAPENMYIFFRSLVMADKLLLAAEKLREETGEKPRIAFNVGLGHSGMEDFLLAGHDFTRWLIVQYPKPVLQEIIRINGGVKDFASIRLLTIPADFDPKLLQTSEDWEVETNRRNRLNSMVEDKQFVDNSLVKMLMSKGVKDKELDRRRNRETEIKELRGLFNKYIKGDMLSKINAFLDSLMVLDVAKYRSTVLVRRYDGGTRDTVYTEFFVHSLEYPYVDMSGLIVKKNGNPPSTERFTFFIDSTGELTQEVILKEATIIIPKDKVEGIIKSIFINVPDNLQLRERVPLKEPKGILSGRYSLRSQIVEQGSVKTYYGMTFNGMVEFFTWSDIGNS